MILLNLFRPFMSREAYTRLLFKRIDEARMQRGEIYHYECQEGHKWKSYSSPTGSYCAGKFGMEETRCPKCATTICKAMIYKNGVYLNQGTVHEMFGRKNARNRNKKS